MPVLNWSNREDNLKAAKALPFRVLEFDAELSHGDANAENLIIQGDTLETLKALLPLYSGKLKCVVIAPPCYGNLEDTGCLEMLYPCLELLSHLLAEDGSIWVAVNDNAVHYVKVIMDEIFGRENFVANCVWQKKDTCQNDTKWIANNHKHLVLFAKNKSIWRPFLLPRNEKMNDRYKNPDNDPRGNWKTGDLSVKTYSAKTDYPITVPSGRIVKPPKGYCWRFSKEKYQEMLNDNRIWFGKNGDNVPAIKRFLNEVKQGVTAMTIWSSQELGCDQDTGDELPEQLFQRVLMLATNQNDLVLDAFTGIGTLPLVAHKMNRHYIGIETGNAIKIHCVSRLKKVIDGNQNGISLSVNWKGGGGYRFYRLGHAILDKNRHINPAIRFVDLASYLWFKETHVPYNKRKEEQSCLLGVHNGVAYYLLYKQFSDKKLGSTLTRSVLNTLPKHPGEKIIYAESNCLGDNSLKAHHITFKQIPYAVLW